MRALITGHRGFIGRHLHRECDRLGWSVYGVDITDGDDAREFFAEDDTRFDVVFHCAAIVGGRAKIDGDPLAVATNIGLDVAAFQWALRAGPGRFVYWSSSAAYPVANQTRQNHRPLVDVDLLGQHVGLPDATYGWAKLTGELLAQEARRQGLKVDIYRPFSGYGEDQDLDYPFPSFIQRAREHRDPFEVWGNGTQVRDWVHVDDIVAAVFAGLARDQQVGPLNLCTGRGTSFRTLAGLCMDAAGYQAPLLLHPDAPTGVHTRVGDPCRMRQLHTPTVTLEEGIARCFR